MLNAKAWQMTTTEREYYIKCARESVLFHNKPHAIFFDTGGAVRIEQWRGESFGGAVMVVLPSWVEVVA